ncbi:hypothetical protein HRbin29_01185 [bacterium HR29]|jgi:hypothetical protein|nr:hypothetical protein HRbin29_01185 [bacterium HR29]
MTQATIPGYRMGDPALPPSALDDEAFAKVCAALLLNEEDRQALREAKAIVEPHIEELLDVWYGFVGSHDFLLQYFSTPEGPNQEYLTRVRARFGQWVRDTLSADFGPAWRAYQAEVGRRHAASKNQTDGVRGAPEVVHFRYMVALVYPIYATIRPFLARGARDNEHLERMHQAWLKAVLLNLCLWSEAYVKDGWF